MSRQVSVEILQKWGELVQLIVSLTRKNKLHWEETANDDEFVAPYGAMAIVLSKMSSKYGTAIDSMYLVSFRDSRGKVVDSFSDEDLDGDISNTETYMILKELMDSISRKISGADEVLQSLISDMRDDDDDDPTF